LRSNLVSSAALRFQQQRSEIMINISQRVNYFFQRRDQHTASITSQPNESAANYSGARLVQPCFLFRTAFPLARKRRDSKQALASAQEGIEHIFSPFSHIPLASLRQHVPEFS
ncbi:hypothetical protein, partial [Burkholderia gladioli]|uniref:hypothetical protein n=2 Tax=Burkholderia gladioli TaxID=28095 RepID=UPI001ABBC604